MATPSADSLVIASFKPWHALKLALLPVALLFVMAVGASTGPESIPLRTVLTVVLSHLDLATGHGLAAWQSAIVWDIRLPEVCAAALVGAALAVSGVALQAVLRNPLADPFVIGTSSGAMFGVAVAFWIWSSATATISVATWQGFGLPQLFAFAGAVLAVGLVFALTTIGRRAGPVTFLLAGFAVSTLMIAAMWFVAYQGGHVNQIFGWMMGSLANSEWSQLEVVGPVIVGGCLILFLFVRDLNALLLGEEQATYMGLNVARSRLLLVGIATALTALAVALAGIIGFVGLVIPHVSRLVYGPNHKLLVPCSAMVGAIFLVLSDVLARTIEAGGGELPLGIITALVGVPVFLALLLRTGEAYSF